MPETEFLELMPHTITLASITSRSSDGYYKLFHGTARSYRGLVEQGNTLIRDATGSEVVARTTVYVYTTTGAITVEDRITLPDGTTPAILDVRVFADENGTHHKVIYCAD